MIRPQMEGSRPHIAQATPDFLQVRPAWQLNWLLPAMAGQYRFPNEWCQACEDPENVLKHASLVFVEDEPSL